MNYDEQLLEPLIKVFLSQMDSAMRISDIVAKHENSDEISVDNIIGGLVYRLMIPMNEQEIEESFQSADDIMDHLDESDSNEEETEEFYENIETEEPTEFRKIKAPICNCDICSKLRVCLLNYHMHECKDTLEEKFKQSIETTCQKHKLII